MFVILAKQEAAGRTAEKWYVHELNSPVGLQNKLNELVQDGFIIFSVIWRN